MARPGFPKSLAFVQAEVGEFTLHSPHTNAESPEIHRIRAIPPPVNTLASNGAWMVMTALAWTLKTWWALMLPVSDRRQKEHGEEKHRVLRLEFKSFVNEFVTIPCEVIKTGRSLVLRVPGWNPHLMTFFRLVSHRRQ